MTAAILLLLVTILPDQRVRHATVAMPSAALCLAARDAYLAQDLRDGERGRSALCVAVPAPGVDA